MGGGRKGELVQERTYKDFVSWAGERGRMQ